MKKSNLKYFFLIFLIFTVIGIIAIIRLSGLTLMQYDEGGGLPEDFEEYMQEMYGEDYASLDLPTNPSIIINNGELTTNQFIVTVEVSCENADEMSFKLTYDYDWTAWEQYTTITTVTLPENSVDYPEYRVAVKFKNADGESEQVWYDITYTGDNNDNNDNNDDNGGEPPVDITQHNLTYIYWIIIALGLAVGVILLLQFTIFKKRGKKKKF